MSAPAVQLSRIARRLPVGADVQTDGSTHFRVWAPRPRDVRLVIHDPSRGDREIPLDRESDGVFSALVSGIGAGTRYRFRLDDHLFADPASRFQPEGPFGPSEVVDPTGYQWTDDSWRGITLRGQVLYELHIGTFTPEGTWRAAIDRLGTLARLGVTTIEVMPVSEFPGRFGWGYDGVFPYAPTRLYGLPDDFRAFVDAAHRVGLGVILDVVYNHLGPSGCVHREYSSAYFTRRYENEWGDALNFDGSDAGPVRDYFVANAGYWIDEFHLDGLRLDAIQSIHDRSPESVVAAVARRAREAAGGRNVVVIAENERQDTTLLHSRDENGAGIDAVWNDDFHHSMVVALTGRREAYYSDHHGTPQELISAVKYGYLFQGQRYAWQKQARGGRTDGLPPEAFVAFVENHDQIANSGLGARLHQRAAPDRYRALIALFLLMPATPLLFQGQEFGSTRPFLYFADHEGDLAEAVRAGRAAFLAQFSSLAAADAQARLPSPHDPTTFERCKLQWDEWNAHSEHRQLYEDLLAIRREDHAFVQQRPGAVDGALLRHSAFVLRFATPSTDDERLLVINLGADLVAGSFAEPLVAPPSGYEWRMRWSSEHVRYGGTGAYEILTGGGWRIPGQSATVLAPAHVNVRRVEAAGAA
jgi:maltooligosyltrehalose trehalohydrolase